MTLPLSPSKTQSWPISVGAEGIAAAQFARCGFDVLVQTCRDKPWYDFAVTRAGNLLTVSVKASDDGRWNLTEGFSRRSSEPGMRAVDSRSAIDLWAGSQGSKTICCLVQFEGVTISQMPRVYLAFPFEIAAEMRVATARTGQAALQEQYEWTSTAGVREVAALPSSWRFSQERIRELLDRHTSPGLLSQGRSMAAPMNAPVPIRPTRVTEAVLTV